MSSQKIFITGASTGIGFHAACFLRSKNYSVWASARKPADLERLRAAGITAIEMDVCDPASIAKACVQLPTDLDALINNAGIAIGGPLEALQWQDWKRQFDTNVLGLVEVTRQLLPKLRQQKGRIINIGSISGKIASPLLSAYCASKFAVEAISDALRRELKPQGIRVILLEPGAIRTEIWGKSKSEAEKMIETWPKNLVSTYQKQLDSMVKSVQTIEQRAAPVEAVSFAILRALEFRNPKARYTIGRGMGAASWMANHFPDALLDRILRFG